MEGERQILKGAGVCIRFLALLIDALVFLPISYIIAVVFGTYGSSGFELEGPGLLLSTLLGLAYYVLFEGKKGATLGKMAVGLKVVKLDGSPCDVRAAVLRTVLRVIDALPAAYIIGVISVWVTELNQRIGDKVAGTIVVRVKNLK
ncbi:MAG: RDD family protein [Veillonellaceae bacterium]|nr:RDD family protein [Veillonellaceae bacterium]